MILAIKGPMFECLINCLMHNIQFYSYLRFLKAFKQEVKTVYRTWLTIKNISKSVSSLASRSCCVSQANRVSADMKYSKIYFTPTHKWCSLKTLIVVRPSLISADYSTYDSDSVGGSDIFTELLECYKNRIKKWVWCSNLHQVKIS